MLEVPQGLTRDLLVDADLPSAYPCVNEFPALVTLDTPSLLGCTRINASGMIITESEYCLYLFVSLVSNFAQRGFQGISHHSESN